MTKKTRLYKFVKKYIKDNNIASGESVQQMDSLAIDATNFMEKCCEIVGYYKEENGSIN